MAKKKGAGSKLWDGVDINADFEEGLARAEEVDIAEFNKEKMTLFSANINYARQLMRLSDSLTPVQRRILYTLYQLQLKPGHKKKSISAKGGVTEIHPHGGDSVYATIVGMAQYWKMPIPLIKMYGSYGTEVSAIYAADRYTELNMSQYAWDCFFKDYDSDCVQSIFNTAAGRNEPVSIPSRYPNMLINGQRAAIAIGNSARIPPFNINDVIREVKKQLYTPTTGHVYMIPDFPTGCDVIDDGENVKKICETGKGVLTMRAKTEILDEGKHWCIQVTNLPWGVTQESVVAAITNLMRNDFPIKDWQNRTEQEYLDNKTIVSRVKIGIIVDKAHDPYAIREKLFKKTKMEETISVDFNVVLEGLELARFSLGDLIRSWITERREYKRRLLNKRISKCTARIETLKILIEICTGDNAEKTARIIRHSSEDMVAKNLVKEYGMSSFQAEQIADMKYRALNKDAAKRYAGELKEREEELKRLYHLVRSEKDIDDMIAAELDELKAYSVPRQSQCISPQSGQAMDVDTEYFIIATKRGGLKKVSVAAVEHSRKGFGAFEQKDYPTHMLRGKNPDSLLFVDSFGKFSMIKVGDIDTMALADLPAKAYTVTKLEGEIISMQYFQTSEVAKWLDNNKIGELFLITISKDGFAKKTPISELIDMTDDGLKNCRNLRLTKLKQGDVLTHANYYIADTALLIYTAKGSYNYIYAENIPAYGRDAVGNRLVQLDGDDYVSGCCAINQDCRYVVLLTAKGYAKKVELQFMGDPSPSKATSYLATLEPNDTLIYADTPCKSIDICTRLKMEEVSLDSIKTLGRKAKCAKIIKMEAGDNIIRVATH